MGLSWHSKDSNIEQIRSHIDACIAHAQIPSFASLLWENDELCIRINQAGKSEFRIAILAAGKGVRIAETKRDVALFHRAFVGTVEKFVDKILSEAGFDKD